QTVEFCRAVAKNRINPSAKSLLINVHPLCVASIRKPNRFIPYIATTINWCALCQEAKRPRGVLHKE
ncbi:MAG: hypothetical protein FWG14_11715, partial [Peptococcaceae bacterium]|nr:hypothetical protein [Peptococcaceae bacterium]